MKPLPRTLAETALQILEAQRDLGLKMSLEHREVDEKICV